MKRLIYSFLAVSFCTILTTGIFAQAATDMKTLVATMNQDLIEMAKTGRFEAMAKYYDKEAISLPNYRAMEKGYSTILTNNQGRKSGGYKIVDGGKTTIELFVGKDMMVDIGSYTLTMDFPGLPQPKVDTGKYMNVWRKDAEGNWRIIAETWNADKSPNAPAQPQVRPARTTGGEGEAKPK